MPELAFPYDVLFNIAGDSTQYGFMLSTPEGSTKQIEINEAGQPEAVRVQTKDIAGNQDFDPVHDTVFAMGNFSGGVGQLYFEEGNETKFLWGRGVVHVEGKAYLPPATSALSLSGATGGLTGHVSYVHTNGTRYDFLWEGVDLWRRDASNNSNAWAKVYTASFAITDFAIMDGVGFIFCPSDTSNDFYSQSDITAAATWTPTARNHTPFGTGTRPSYGKAIRGTFYVSVNTNLIYFNVDPTVDSWIGPIDTGIEGNISGPPGDGTYAIKNLRAVGDFLFVIKNDAVYQVDSGQDVIELIWEWKDKPSDYNFKYVGNSGNKFLFNIGTEVRYYDPHTGMNRDIGLSMQSGFSVREILGLAGDERYIYVLAKVRVPNIYASDTIALFRCYPSLIADTGYSYEVLWEDTAVSAEAYGFLFASPAGAGTRLYWGRNPDSGDTQTYLMECVPEWDSSGGAGFTTDSCNIYTSISRSGFLGHDKKHLYFNSDAQNVLNNEEEIAVAYSLDNGGTFTTLGVMETNEYTESYDNKYSKAILYRFALSSVDGAETPVLTSFDHHQRVRFKYLPRMSMGFRIGRTLEMRDRNVITLDFDTYMDRLTTLRSTNNKVTYNDFMGNTFPVSIDSVSIRPTRHQGQGEVELEAVVIATRADEGD